MSKGNNKENMKDMEKMMEEIDYSAVIARLAGTPLTKEQEESCKKFDEVYDATHPNKKESEKKK